MELLAAEPAEYRGMIEWVRGFSALPLTRLRVIVTDPTVARTAGAPAGSASASAAVTQASVPRERRTRRSSPSRPVANARVPVGMNQ